MSWFKTAAETFFTEEEGHQIVASIKAAEKNTSGEIRLHLATKSKVDPMEEAWKMFTKLEMHETALRNGVLIYLSVKDHKFAIVADQGINQVVPDGFWKSIAQQMSAQFKNKAFVEGLSEGIKKIGEQLKAYFPYQEDDENELPDEISFG
ncbi:MAG: TPM domain-containing protein [Bacteroidota bacterium]